MSDLDEFQKRVAAALGHEFSTSRWLLHALTHRSFANERPQVAPDDNERLEFLGDAVLGMLASALLWHRFPSAPEGELTRRRADLVCEANLAAIARQIGIGEALRLGRGEEKSGGRDKPRLLASAFEACLGAIYLDGGIDAAFAAGRAQLEGRMGAVEPGARDYKSRLQELVQRDLGATPIYEVLATDGPDHERSFHMAVLIEGRQHGDGRGRSKLAAEQAAAQAALVALEVAPAAGAGAGQNSGVSDDVPGGAGAGSDGSASDGPNGGAGEAGA